MYFIQYWHWAGSNIGAMPAQALISGIAGVVFAVFFRRPLVRIVAWWQRVGREARGEAVSELAEVRDIAERAARIAADLFERHTGEAHPDAPPPRE